MNIGIKLNKNENIKFCYIQLAIVVGTTLRILKEFWSMATIGHGHFFLIFFFSEKNYGNDRPWINFNSFYF